MPQYDYDFAVIGGGSGGVRAARLAAQNGARTAIFEADRYGGTCVIRGCVPKKLLVYASQYGEELVNAKSFGWQIGTHKFNWNALIAAKDKEIARLENLYQENLTKAGVTIFHDHASFLDAHRLHLQKAKKTVTAEKILIATGGRENRQTSLEGHAFCITSREAFHLAQFPQDIVITGGGYIAIEFACIFHNMGANVTLVYRGQEILKNFDCDLRRNLQRIMVARGIRILTGEVIESVTCNGEKRYAKLSGGTICPADQIMLALGRTPNSDDLQLDRAGVTMDKRGAIVVNDFSQTAQPHIWAVGDVTNRVNLTPVAIHEAACVIATAFCADPTPADHKNIATAVFSQPEIGTIGLSEDAALAQNRAVKIYRRSFIAMKNALAGRREETIMKLVVDAKNDAILGVHILGADAGEIIQAVAIAVKMGATKADFDHTMAVHPTAAEELVTMQ